MLAVISPAKKLNEKCLEEINFKLRPTKPRHLAKTEELIKGLKKLKIQDFSKLMGLSEKLATLNFERYQHYENTDRFPALWFFAGDTYQGLEATTLKEAQAKKAQEQVRILSGLYGMLRPFDAIAPYRLEMGTSFGIGGAKNLYEIWKEDVTKKLNEDLKEHTHLINLASDEYFSVIDKKALKKPVITPRFLDFSKGKYKVISFNAKRARGAMANFLITNSVSTPKALQKFTGLGYEFDPTESTELAPVFKRKA